MTRSTASTRALIRDMLPVLPVLLFCVVLVLVGSAQSPVFLSTFNLGNLAAQILPLLLVAIGQTYAVGSGGLDLSVGSIVSLVAVTTAVSFTAFGIPGAVLMGFAAGIAIGALNGLFVSRGIEPFLVTLGTLSLAQGIALFISAVPSGDVPGAYRQIAAYWGNIPIILPAVVALTALAIWSVKRTRAGANIVAVGGNREVAYLNGVPIRKTYIKAYMLSAVFAVLAALFLVARTSTGDPTIGARFTLDSLAAVVLGGTFLGGGRIVMLGTVFGAIALGLLSNVLNLLQVSAFYQTPLKGLLVIGAVLLPTLITHAVSRHRARSIAASMNRSSLRLGTK